MPKPLTIDGREVHRNGVYVVTGQSNAKGKRLPFPRKPRGEKPATTIRLQRRIIHNMQLMVEHVRKDRDVQVQTINGLNAYKDDLENEIGGLRGSLDIQDRIVRDVQGRHQDVINRLNFLEGYYAAKQETIPPQSRYIIGNQSETDYRGCSGNTENLRNDQSGPEKDRQDARAPRPQAGHREEIRSERNRNRQDPERDALENFEVGVAHDAEPRYFRSD